MLAVALLLAAPQEGRDPPQVDMNASVLVFDCRIQSVGTEDMNSFVDRSDGAFRMQIRPREGTWYTAFEDDEWTEAGTIDRQEDSTFFFNGSSEVYPHYLDTGSSRYVEVQQSELNVHLTFGSCWPAG
jgi:hypothetical protein